MHKHSCGYKWLIRPNDILQGYSCPICAESGFNENIPATLYLIKFINIPNLYKVGISNDYITRLNRLQQPSTIIILKHFDTGLEAKAEEVIWLHNLKNYMYNTGLLKSGNTETFKFEDW